MSGEKKIHQPQEGRGTLQILYLKATGLQQGKLFSDSYAGLNCLAANPAQCRQ